MNKKKVGVFLVVILVVIGVIAGAVWFFFKGNASAGSSKDKVFVQKVSKTMSWNNGANSNYSGVVESQETCKVNKEADRTIKEVCVAVGDSVDEGTVLFTYDTREQENQITQLKLEMEGISNDISNTTAQIKELEKEKKTAPEDQQFEYTTQIQSLQTSIKQSEYDKKGKQTEIDRAQQAIDNSSVMSKIAGVVKSINESGVDEYGNSDAYMTILATGDYRVKGQIDEQNVYNLNVGQEVIVRSRVDETKTWRGTITVIDTEKPESEESNKNYYMDGGNYESATKYPFYITLDSTNQLLLGQHVFIEPDYGQTEKKEGVWLEESYLMMEENATYVWAASKKDKLEKREVTLGEYDDNVGCYEIVSGLTMDDYIAWPMPGLYEGVKTVTDEAEVDYSAPLYNQEMTDDQVDDMGVMEELEPMDDTQSMEEFMRLEDTEVAP